MRETLEQLVARLNASAFIPPQEITAVAKAVKLAKGKEFTFATPKAGGQASKYPWDEWFSPDPKAFPNGLVYLERSTGTEDEKGTITTISEKKDYEVSTNAMLPKIKTAARRRYKMVQVSRMDADGNRLVDALIIRGRDMTAEERVAEDILRAEEKEAKRAGKEDGDDLSIGNAPEALAS